MRLIHISDLHLGKTVAQVPLCDDQEYILMEQVLPLLKEKNIDALLISGDLFDTYNPSGEAMEIYDRFLAAVNSLSIPVFAISGNHDSVVRVSHHHTLLKEAKYYISSEYKGNIEKVTIPDEYGDVTFWLLPFVTPNDVRPYLEDKNRGMGFADALEEVIKREEIDTTKRNVILSHQYVAGGERDASDTKPTITGADAVPSSVYQDFDYVALGHIHKTQIIKGNHCLVYPGAILPYHIDDVKERFVSYVELGEKGDVKQEFIPLHLKRQFISVVGDLDYLKQQEGNDQDYVYVTLTGKESSPSLLEDLKRKYPLLLNIRLQLDSSSEIKDITSGEATERTPIESIGAFFHDRTGREMSEEEHQLVEELFHSLKEKQA